MEQLEKTLDELETRGASLPRPVHDYLLLYTDKEYALHNADSK